jgi:hypothetical protein
MKKQKKGVRNRSNTDRKEVVLSEPEFVKRVQALAAKLAKNQLAISKLVHAYIEEHGMKYGDGVFKHIAEITGLAVRSINHYYDLYCLRVEFKDLATLPNLSLSKQYEIARLFKYPETKPQIPELVEKANKDCMRTVDVEAHVDKLLKEAGRFKQRKPKPEQAPAPEHSPAPQIFGKKDESVLTEAVAVLDLAMSKDTKLAVNMAEHVTVLHQLSCKLVEYLAWLVEMGEGFSLATIVQRLTKELVELQQKIAQQETAKSETERQVA